MVRQKPAKLRSPVRIWVPPHFFSITSVILLYLVPTPIGHLQDITLRAIETLKTCDYILCEDTRHSLILLKHYKISKPLKSFHKFNETESQEKILKDLKEGKIICLISDAGTPGISDPGERLISLCIEKGVPVSSLPGPCAAITAIISSGLTTERFQFCGFLAKKEQALQHQLIEILQYPGTSICYESPHRVVNLLEKLNELAPTRHVVLARELTKKFEEYDRGTAASLFNKWQLKDPKGEFVVLIGMDQNPQTDWEQLSVTEHIEKVIQEFHLSKKEAIKLVAELRHLPKKEVYKETL